MMPSRRREGAPSRPADRSAGQLAERPASLAARLPCQRLLPAVRRTGGGSARERKWAAGSTLGAPFPSVDSSEQQLFEGGWADVSWHQPAVVLRQVDLSPSSMLPPLAPFHFRVSDPFVMNFLFCFSFIAHCARGGW